MGHRLLPLTNGPVQYYVMNHGMIGHATQADRYDPCIIPARKIFMAPSTTKKRNPCRPAAQKSRTQKKHPAQSAAQDLTNIPDIDLARAEKTVLELLKIPGISGQEKQVAEIIQKNYSTLVAQKVLSHLTKHTKTPIQGNCGNLIVKFPGTYRGPRRLLMRTWTLSPFVGNQPCCSWRHCTKWKSRDRAWRR